MKERIDVRVGRQLRQRRAMMGFSQGALGDAIGVTFQQIQKYERGETSIPVPRLHQLARALYVPIGHFFGEPSIDRPSMGRDQDNDRRDEATVDVGKHELQFHQAFARIPGKVLRAKLAQLVRAIADGRR